MFLAKRGNLIIFATETETELYNLLQCVNVTEIVETEERYILKNGVYKLEAEVLEELKEEKNEENTLKAKESIENGYVDFKDAQFETNSQTVGDLTATMLLMQATGQEETKWLSKDDKEVTLTIDDFGLLGALTAEYKNDVWQNKYVGFKTQIDNAETIEEVESIVIDYNEAEYA